jgi:hypothetical protein
VTHSYGFALAAIALAACTRPAPRVDVDARAPSLGDTSDAAVDSPANSQTVRDASVTTRTVPIAFARGSDGETIAVVRVASRSEDEEIRPTLGALGARATPTTTIASPSRLIERRPDHRVLRVSSRSAWGLTVDPETGSWLVLDSRAIVALPLDPSAPPTTLERDRWTPAEPGLAALLRRTVGAGETARAIDPSTIVTSAAGPAAVFAACAEGEHRWGGRPCATHVVTTTNAATVDAVTEPVLAARAHNGTTAILRPHCPRAAAVVRCPIEAVTYASATPTVSALGWLAFDSVEGNSTPGWSQLVPYKDTILAAWSARDTAEGAARFSLRIARYEPASRRWTALPPIASESIATAHAIGADPLTVLWSERDDPSRFNLSTLEGTRWSTTVVATSTGTLVDAMIDGNTRGGAVLWMLLEHAAGDAEVMLHAGSNAPWESIWLRSE